jgi:uncharacterized repeat protein (TIGR01451 family)
LNHGALTVVNSTVTANYAKRDGAGGGGIDTSLGTLQLSNSILANNFFIDFTNNTPGIDLIGSRGVNGVSGNYNLVQNGATITGTNNITGQPALLGPLANNGGPTQTHALLTDSPAIDKGSAAGTDQRGVTRPSDDPSIPNAADGNGADIGAFEVQIAPPAPADLTIVKSHAGDFTQGDTGKTYTITVTNSGSGATSGTVSVTDTLPTGLTATAITGAGWTCTLGSLTCTRGDALAAAGNYSAITLTVNVANDAPASVTNRASVSGGGETNTGNNTANDPTVIGSAARYMVSGRITNGGEGLSGVAVSISGSATARATTDASGNYSFANLTGGGNYTITPTLNGYTFVEPSISVNSLAADQPNQNFATSTVSYEGDVATRPTGNGSVDIFDMVAVSNMIANLPNITPLASGSEYQRADAAPRSSKGDGAINVQDLVVMGLYAASLNPLTPAGGPTTPISPSPDNLIAGIEQGEVAGKADLSESESAAMAIPSAGTATISAGTTTASGGAASIPIQLTSTNIGAVQFSVTYDSTKLLIPSIAAITGQAGSTLFTFNNDTPGQLGVVALRSPAGTTFPASTVLFNINFTVINGASGGASTIGFSNAPVPVKASDPVGEAATQTTLTPGAVTIIGATAAPVSISGRVVTASGRGIRNVQITMIDSQGTERTTQTTAFGYYCFDNVEAGETITLSVKARRFKFAQSSIVRTTNDSVTDADFVSVD